MFSSSTDHSSHAYGQDRKHTPHQPYSGSSSFSSNSSSPSHDVRTTPAHAPPHPPVQNRAPDTQTQSTETQELAPAQPEVDSWEDIDTSEQPSSEPSPPKPETHPTPLQNQPNPQTTKSTKSTHKDNSDLGKEGDTPSHKHKGNDPSPPIHEKVPKAKDSKAVAAMPKKGEDEKENVNIVFIGHVGEWVCLCVGEW